MIKFPLTTRLLHWFSAASILFLFFSGWYMVELDYYSTWYQTLPDLHQLVGVFIMGIWFFKILRLFWVKNPKPLTTLKRHEILLSNLIKLLFYFLVLSLCFSGYFISTGGGDQHSLLDIILLPTFYLLESDSLDFLGSAHKYMAYVIMILVLLHLLAALKHHFYDRDDTLRRII